MGPSYPTTSPAGPGYQDPLTKILQQPFKPSEPGYHREPLPKYLRDMPFRPPSAPGVGRPPARVPGIPYVPIPNPIAGPSGYPSAFTLARLARLNPSLQIAGLLLDAWLDSGLESEPMMYPDNGYIYRGDCGETPLPVWANFWVDVGSNALTCLSGQAQYNQNFSDGSRPKWLHRFQGYDALPGFGRGRSHYKFERIDWLTFDPTTNGLPRRWPNTPANTPPQPDVRVPATIVNQLPETWQPWHNPLGHPEGLPIQRPLPLPPLVPFSEIPHRLNHPEKTRENGDPQPRPNWEPKPLKPPYRHPVPRPRPSPVPTVDVTPGKPINHNDTPHYASPPGPRNKERKYTTSGGFLRVFADFLGVISEVSDVVWALYNALPWKVRSFKGKDGKWHPIDVTIQDRIERIYENAHLLDPGKFIQNLIENELQDASLGRAGRIGKEAVQQLARQGLYHSPVGYQTGPVM